MKQINCPRCSRMFSKVKLRQIAHPKGCTIDVCDICHGMWLDGNEVDILLGGKKWQKKKSK